MRVGPFDLSQRDLTYIGIAIGAFILFRKQAASLTHDIVSGAAEAVGGVVVSASTGAVVGVAKAVGIPETDRAACDAAVAAGDWWGASFACPAGTFVQSAWGALFDPATGEEVGSVQPSTGRTEVVTVEPLPGIDPGTDAQISDWVMP